ncbi:MAG: phage portal protein [Rikenellaceae bacterium]
MTTTKIAIANNSSDPYVATSARLPQSDKYWRWGEDNRLPDLLALMARRAVTHRRIINDKADYITGKGFAFDSDVALLNSLVDRVNGEGETLRQLLNKIAFDKVLFANAFLEVVTDDRHSSMALYHHDASKCRVARDSKHILIHHDWSLFKSDEAKSLPLYPNFESFGDGTQRAVIHYKDYEPTFQHYGVPPYIAGLGVSAIVYKTDRWNISRLDNSFQMSGVMLLDDAVNSEQEASRIINAAEQRFGGKPGQVLFVVKDGSETDNSRFIPITSSSDGDWATLHDQANEDIVIAHSWFQSLSGMDYSSGFSTERILQEYEIALNTIIIAEQEELLEPIRDLIGSILTIDASSLNVINTPPTRSKPTYMKVWEARRADGLDYDPNDAQQQIYLAQLSTSTTTES